MNRRILLSIFMTLSITIMCMAVGAVEFSDIDGHWAYDQIVEYAQKGVVNGDPEGTFRPDDSVSREEFSKILLNAFGEPVILAEQASFSDVAIDSWSSPYVEGAKKYLSGYSDGTFLPQKEASRIDVVEAIIKLMGYPADSVSSDTIKASFTDVEGLSEDKLSYVAIAVERELVNGFPDGTFRAEAGVTRAEAVTLLSRAVKEFNNKVLSWEDAEKLLDNICEKTTNDTTVLMSVDGYDVSLAEYRYYYFTYARTFDQYFGPDWVNHQESMNLFDDYVSHDSALSAIIYTYAKANDIKISYAGLKQVFSSYDYFYSLYNDDIVDYLESIYATPYYLLKNNLAAVFAAEIEDSLYGIGGKLFDESAKKFAESYVRAKHVLIMFDDITPKESLLATAKEVHALAVAGEDFDKLVNQYNMDPGMRSNPDGYVFTYGMMVEPFEKATYALGDNQISDIVETDYGYHIIKRLPLDNESIVKSEAYKSMAESACFSMHYGYFDSLNPVFNENYDALLISIFNEAGHLGVDNTENTEE